MFIYSIHCVKACLSNELRAVTCQISFWRVVFPLGVIASTKNSSGGIIAAQAVQMQLCRFEEFTSDAWTIHRTQTMNTFTMNYDFV